MHQKGTTTARDRYPEIFAYVQRLNPDAKKILSFGCSTGEEICSLQEYFPHALITGVDIDSVCLGICNLKGLNAIHYLSYRTSSETYDIIFAMSVLCRYEGNENDIATPEIYPFSKFEKELFHLVNRLNIGGFLVVFNASYMVSDTISSNNLKELYSVSDEIVPKYDKHGTPVKNDFYRIMFQKVK